MNNKIKKIRQELNLTQEELANRAGVRRETIVFLEKGKYNPSLNLAHKISKILNMEIEKIFEFDD